MSITVCCKMFVWHVEDLNRGDDKNVGLFLLVTHFDIDVGTMGVRQHQPTRAPSGFYVDL